jgi:hypothetical protein
VSLFRAAKYPPELSVDGFADLDEARTRAAHLEHLHNRVHRQSGNLQVGL